MTIRPATGPTLEVSAARDCERAFVHATLVREDVYPAFDLAAPPERALCDRGVLVVGRGDEREAEPVRFHVGRLRESGEPLVLFVDFGWRSFHDRTREIDCAVPDVTRRQVGLLFEAQVLLGIYLFGNGLADKLRWALVGREGRPPLWPTRLGASYVGKLRATDAESGAALVKHVFELGPEIMRAAPDLGDELRFDPARHALLAHTRR